jgi:hypothetical protein
MKVLLAPLFFRSRFCKHCARIFYRENLGSWVGIHEFESLPPLGSFDTKRGFIPDFPTLLMFEEFVLDGEAFERLKQPGASSRSFPLENGGPHNIVPVSEKVPEEPFSLSPGSLFRLSL